MSWLEQATIETAAQKQAQEKEKQRQQLKNIRDTSLQALVYDFGDGRVIQTRPQDLPLVEARIAQGVDKNWTLADNTVAVVTVSELETAKIAGILAAEAIWDEYMAGITALNS